MTISELVKGFCNGLTEGQASNRRLRIEGNKLYNYDTLIATRTDKGIRLNVKRYSSTTTKIQGMIRNNGNVIEEYEGKNAYIYDIGEW